MKRLISGAEAVQAGLMPRFPYLERVTPAVERMPSADTYCLWRSLPGYRKACRMLRRSGRRIRRGEAFSTAYYHGWHLARGPDCSAVVAWGEPVLEIHDSHISPERKEATPFRGMDALSMTVDYGAQPDEAWLISGQRVGQMVHVVNLEKAKE